LPATPCSSAAQQRTRPQQGQQQHVSKTRGEWCNLCLLAATSCSSAAQQYKTRLSNNSNECTAPRALISCVYKLHAAWQASHNQSIQPDTRQVLW
jgi:hypothetical protein